MSIEREEYWEDQLNSVIEKFDSVTEIPGYSAFEKAAEKSIMAYQITQTIIPYDADIVETDVPDIDFYNFYVANVDYAAELAASQTFVTGKAKETLTSVYGEVASVYREYYAELFDITATGSIAKPTPTDDAPESSSSTTSDNDNNESTGSKTSTKTNSSTTETEEEEAEVSAADDESAGAISRVSGIFAGLLAGVVAVIAVL